MKAIGAHKGNLITLVLPSSIKINVVLNSLALEYDSTVDGDKRAAISVVQNKLKLYGEVPPNGLVLYCGTISGKEQEVCCAIEPPRAVKFCMYRYGNKFHTEVLDELVQRKYGYVVVHAKGAIFGVAVGDNSKILQTLSVDTPSKYGKMLSSTRCFLKMRMETQHRLVNDTTKLARDIFINPETDVPMIHHLIVVGSADRMPALKCLISALKEPDLFDHRLERKIVGVVGICNPPCDHEQMFRLAVRRTSTYHDDSELQEMLLNRYIKYVKDDKCVCGLQKNTLAAAQLGLMDTLYVWEDLVLNQESNQSNFADEPAILEVKERRSVVDWLLSNYVQFGYCIEIVKPGPPDEPVTSTVNTFCKGLHGIGGILRM
ncbi:hypothetical protein BRADI_4g44730v3 [Brachypodium distachyon]|uniref:eRF1/Pelota-like N-terminal domain-containing protein n=2 Tax=Brachypodium distachyon TaxID=15368 RepID=I1IV47_BRADI|nr:hypothetical protein BRADI_4g44730v3 [Brachypodium distachyon]